MALGARALGLDYAASELDVALKKTIGRNEAPTALFERLMREQLRIITEEKARKRLKKAAIFPLTSLDNYDFDYPKTIDREIVMQAATLNFIKDKTNCVFVGPSGVDKTRNLLRKCPL